MEFIKSKCKKCGYEIVMPEKSENIICGSCGTINHFSKVSSILKQYSDSLAPSNYKEPSDDLLKIPEEAELPYDDGDEDDEVSPEAKKRTKIMTVLFILAPFIALGIEFFKLPSYTVFIIIAVVVGIMFFLRR
jgi:ribosomal protein S27AE